jgi:hypothetical protein
MSENDYSVYSKIPSTYEDRLFNPQTKAVLCLGDKIYLKVSSNISYFVLAGLSHATEFIKNHNNFPFSI